MTGIAHHGGRRARLAGTVFLTLALLGVGFAAYHVLGKRREPNDDQAAAWAALEDGKRALTAANFSAAREHLQRCLDRWPFNAEVHFLMARAARRADDPVPWQAHLYRAESLQWPRDDIQLERRLMQAQSGDVWAVEKSLQDLVASFHPDEVLIVEALVKGYLQARRVDDALAWAGFWAEHHPGDWQPHLFRGRAFDLLHDARRAIPEYQAVLDVRREHSAVRQWLASALMMDGQYQEALREYETCLRTDPHDLVALRGVANCRFSLNDPEGARQALDRLFAVSKDDAVGCLLRSRLELAEHGPAAAMPWVERAAAKAPAKADILQTLASVQRQLAKDANAAATERRLDEVRRDFKRLDQVKVAVRKEPKNVSLRYDAGKLCLRLGLDDEAGDWFRSVLALEPNHALTHRALAEQFGKLGLRDRAEFHRRRAEGKP